MELHLSRVLQERRIFPAFNIDRSSTRREELLLGPDVLQRVWTMRRMLAHLMDEQGNSENGLVVATEQLLQQLRMTDSNEEFLMSLGRPSDTGSRR